jgi:hypothetical protein
MLRNDTNLQWLSALLLKTNISALLRAGRQINNKAKNRQLMLKNLNLIPYGSELHG